MLAEVTELHLDLLSNDEATRSRSHSELGEDDQDAEKQELRKLEDFDRVADTSLKEKRHQINPEIASMQQLVVDARAQDLEAVDAVRTHLDYGKEISHKTAQDLVDSLDVEYDAYNNNSHTALGAHGYLSVSSTTVTIAPVAISTGTTMTMPAANSVHMVLYDENLIREILLHLAHGINLVRAALVSKFWLAVSSDPIFLKRFRERHAPCLLGYYIVAERLLHPRFVALVNPPELGTMISRAASQFDIWVDVPVTIWGCKNGRLLIDICDKLEVRSHLSPPYAIAAYPQSPMKVHLDESFQYQYHEFLPEDGGDGHEYCRLVIGHRGNEIVVYFFLLHGHIWVVRKSKVALLPFSPESSSTPFLAPYAVLGHGMSYVMTSWRLIVVVDVESLEISVVELPEDLSEDYYDFDLCQSHLANNFCLFGLSQSELRIWVCDLGSSSPGIWFLLRSVSIRDLFGHITIDKITLHGVEELGELVYLQADGVIYELKTNTKMVTKIYEMLPEDGDFERIYPCMTVWPPIFLSRDELAKYEENSVSAGKVKAKVGGDTCSSGVGDKQKIRIRLFRDEPDVSDNK